MTSDEMTSDEMNSEEEWEECSVDVGYEICTSFPFQIRNKKTKYILAEYLSNGYPSVNLNGKTHNKHRIIGLQFIPNPDGLPQIDHRNRIRTDNRIENLHWVSRAENNSNKASHHGHEYEYFDELPSPCQPFVFYNGHEFENYMIDQDHNIYFHNSVNYRKLAKLLMRHKTEYYKLVDIYGKGVSVYLSKIDDYL
jgi:hypothetical protein